MVKSKRDFVYQKALIRTFHYKITFVNSQLENTNSKGDFVLKNICLKISEKKSDSDLA